MTGWTPDTAQRRPTGRKAERKLSRLRARALRLERQVRRRRDKDRRLARALAQSEELHRITLASISDAVFLTDELGQLTFVCPNVHVIFGHDRQSVREMGHIARLLGDELVDGQELSDRGEIANIARAITDRDGREHNLLVNVKRVSIGAASRLYTCRDVTDFLDAQADAQDKRIALREVLEGVEEAKKDVARSVISQVEHVLLPLVEATRRELPASRQHLADILADSLEALARPLDQQSGLQFDSLSPTETRICQYVRRGLSSKEIARIEAVSPATVSKHREHIRRKLGLVGRGANLSAYLKAHTPSADSCSSTS
jgi:PAS domain S-box-containing protein